MQHHSSIHQYFYVHLFVDRVCSFSVVVIVVVIIDDDDDDDDAGPRGCQQFWQGFILILVKGEHLIL